jgi:hypothetical protein
MSLLILGVRANCVKSRAGPQILVFTLTLRLSVVEFFHPVTTL